MSTPHISCNASDFASTVIMPGDPMRSQRIAHNYLSNARLVNNVRGVQGYTGEYQGKLVSVMASGMGGPSMGIYSHELFAYMGVETIIRVGTMGAFRDDANLGDIVLAQAACTDSNFLHHFDLPGVFAPIADFELLSRAAKLAEERHLSYRVGNVLTTDIFYFAHRRDESWIKMGVLGCEMETSILYANAAFHHKKALSLLTISDIMVGQHPAMSHEDRERQLDHTIKLALSLA